MVATCSQHGSCKVTLMPRIKIKVNMLNSTVQNRLVCPSDFRIGACVCVPGGNHKQSFSFPHYCLLFPVRYGQII